LPDGRASLHWIKAHRYLTHNKKLSDPLPANAHGAAPRNALRLIELVCGKS